ncbi:16S rRNA (adenine(1518)-N(6)/adenine(1519)-N(6))-dimethyltransferase RsmA [Balneolaceae bacterium ANBcel3]|nr:16S rRNA (adenine(1518)-N(6)/adenine(1519)-N(6))-dimethyltransferase RsmA [Balneolaceae bacterium ANBcel3]
MIKPKKSLGQHFLTDKNTAGRIVRSLQAGKGDRVIEIGPGTGALTGMLYEAYPNLAAFEVDMRSVEWLKERFSGLEIYPESFLDAILEKMEPVEGEGLYVIGNLPYFLTSPILFKTMDAGKVVRQAVFMIQREVAERLAATPRTKAYGILSVQAQVLGRVELLFHVPRTAFNPPPNVESSVISFTSGNDRFPDSAASLPVSLPFFKTVVRQAFQQRRKKLSNALKPIMTGPFPEGFDAGRRAEELEPEEFVDLCAFMAEYQP